MHARIPELEERDELDFLEELDTPELEGPVALLDCAELDGPVDFDELDDRNELDDRGTDMEMDDMAVAPQDVQRDLRRSMIDGSAGRYLMLKLPSSTGRCGLDSDAWPPGVSEE